MDVAISRKDLSGAVEGVCAVVCLLLVWLIASVLLADTLSKLTMQVVLQAVALLSLWALHLFFGSDRATTRQHTLNRPWQIAVIGCLGVVAIYLSAFAYAALLDRPMEPTMVAIRATQGAADWALLLLSVVVLAPIWEELFFRRFLLELFPVRTSRLWAGIGTLATAVVFAAIHRSYEHPSTFVLLAILGCMFAWARLRSGTLWVPMVLHGVAAVAGLSLNFLR